MKFEELTNTTKVFWGTKELRTTESPQPIELDGEIEYAAHALDEYDQNYVIYWNVTELSWEHPDKVIKLHM
jgi:hypothetical protein